MRISEVIGITGAKLLNNPHINSIERLCFSANKSRRGDLFIAQNTKDIKEAIKKGIFAVLFEGDCEIIDDEIAWLRVDSLQSACGFFVRYLLIDYAIKVVAANSIQAEIAQVLFPPQQILFAQKSKIAFLEQLTLLFEIERKEHGLNNLFEFADETRSLDLLNADGKKLPYVFASETFLKEIEIDPLLILDIDYAPLKLYVSSFFSMKVIYEHKFYDIPFPASLFEDFKVMIRLAKSLHIPINLNNINPLPSVKFYSFKDNGYVVEGRKGIKTLIVIQGNEELFNNMALYLESDAKWANKFYLLPKNLEGIPFRNKVFYTSLKDIIEKVKKTSCHFVLLYVEDARILATMNKKIQELQQKQTKRLFDMHLC